MHLRKAIPVLLLYSAMTPLGIGAGMGVEHLAKGNASVIAQSLLQAFASGSFLYLASHETTEAPPKRMPVWEKISLLGGGVGVMALLAIFV